MALHFEEAVVAGGAQDFMEVRHLVLRGSNYDIGWRLAGIARERHNVQKVLSADPVRTRAQRLYLQRSFPIHLERMRGVAHAYGVSLDDDSIEFSGLPYHIGVPACSVVYYPPLSTESGHGVMSRNFDFSTGTITGAVPGPGEMAAASRPYILEVYPDEGYPSLYLCAYELLAGVTDGVNSEGLVVAMMADDESVLKYPVEPTLGYSVGLAELQLLRFLLDTCATVEEAKQALLITKQYYVFGPLHYLIADRHGSSFVWEYSHAHNREYIIDGGGRPQVATNHLLHRYASLADLPGEDHSPGSTYTRYRTLTEAIASHPQKYSLEFIKATNAAVFFDDRVAGMLERPSEAPPRTLWHSVYDATARSLEISFYLRDEPDRAHPSQRIAVRSDHVEIQLGH